jgi:hypothetical protein
MADTVKISGLNEIASGALDDNSVVPVTDGGVTYKLPISKLKAFVGDSFATDAELSAQVSTINSTINGLDTDDISEGSNEYYTNARVTNQVNSLGVISGSAAALRTFLNVEDGADVTDDNNVVAALVSATGISAGDKTTIKSNLEIEAGTDLGGTGTVSSSAQISDFNTFVENSVTSSMTVLSASYAISASYAENAGGGGGNDYISNVVISGTSLTFTGEGNAFSNSVNLSDGDVLTTDDGDSVYLDYNTYLLDSESFASRVGSGGGGSSIPDGTVSSSIQVLGGTDIISSSIQIAELGAGIISSSGQIGAILTTDDISEGTLNFYFTDAKVKTKLNADGVLSGSISGDWNTLANKPVDIVSSSGQVGDFGYITITSVNDLSESVNTRIDNITGLDPDSTNIFTAEQRFAGGIKLTGSIEIQPDGGVSYFSGSGLGLTNIPAENIVGALSAGSSISQGDTSVFTNADSTITLNASTTGSILLTAARGVILTTGSYSGSGANLYDIPQSAIIGGGGSGFGDKIISGSSSASIDTDYLFKVNTGSVFDGDMVVSGSITADSISVGTTGTPTLYSATNINLSASNAVVVTDSPLRLSPQSTSDIAGFSLSTGDIVYNETDNQFQGYINGNWVQLSFTGSDALPAVDLGGTGVISGSQQIAELGANIVSASAQLVSERSILNTEILFVENASITGSDSFTYNKATNTLTIGTISSTDLSFTGTFSGPAGSTGSFSRLEGDSLRINNAIEFPTSDGISPNQVLKTDGAGNIGFATVETLITTQDINTTGTITIGTGSVIGTGSISLLDNLTVEGTINSQTISTSNTAIESNNIRLRSAGQLMLSSSNANLGVVIDDVLVLPERETKPGTPRTGSIIVSASVSGPRPYFYDGTDWTVMF